MVTLWITQKNIFLSVFQRLSVQRKLHPVIYNLYVIISLTFWTNTEDNSETGLLLSLNAPFDFHFTKFFEFTSQDATRLWYNAYCFIARKKNTGVQISSHNLSSKVNTVNNIKQNENQTSILYPHSVLQGDGLSVQKRKPIP